MKKLFTMLLGLGTLFAAYAAPMEDAIPTAKDLTDAGYDCTKNAVLCVRFTGDAKVCNDVYFVGTFSSWAESFKDCPKFKELEKFPGWYAAEALWKSGFQGKPIQAADSKGSFSWDYQCGDPGAWTWKGGEKLILEWGASYEANVFFNSVGAYIYELSYWKRHMSPCVMTSATVNVLVPSDCGMDISNGMWLCWWPGTNKTDKHMMKMTALEGRRFEATFNPNATSYGYYVLNAENEGVDGAHRANLYSTPVGAERQCVEVQCSGSSQHYLDNYSPCDRKDHNYLPTNMVAKPLSKDTVEFSWEMIDQAQSFEIYGIDAAGKWNYLGAYNYEKEQGNKTKLCLNTGAKVSYASWAMGLYASATESWYYFDNCRGNGFTVAGNDLSPRNFVTTDNGDGTYTFKWDCGEVDKFYVEIKKYGTTKASGDATKASFTATLDASESYTCDIISYDAEKKVVGSGSFSFSTYSVASHDISVYVYIPQASGIPTLKGCYVQWWHTGYEKHVVALESDGSNWYHADLKGMTQNDAWLKVMNAAKEEEATLSLEWGYSVYQPTYFIVNKDEYGNYVFGEIEAGYYKYDYCAYDIEVTPKQDRVLINFDRNENAHEYYIYIIDQFGNQVCQTYAYDLAYSEEVTIYMDNPDAGKYRCRIIPYTEHYSYSELTGVYSAPFEAQASNIGIKNVKLSPKGDGSYTLSWDPIENINVAYYNAYLYDPNDNSIYLGQTYYDKHSLPTPYLTLAGNYDCYIYASDGSGNTICDFYLSNILTIYPVEAHDITLKALIHADSGYDLSGGVSFEIFDKVNGWEKVDAADKGNRWYSVTRTTTDPGLKIRLGGYEFYTTKDACFQYSCGGEWSFVACDAEAEDRNIIPTSLVAVSKPGRAEFSWSVDTESDRYYVELLLASDHTVSIGWGYTSDTRLQYAVPDDEDGTEVVWRVRPIDPYELDEVLSTDKITLKKSEVAISDLTTTTDEDSVAFNFSWKCNKENLKFEIKVIANGDLWKHDTVATTSYSYTMPINGEFYWCVRPLDPADNNKVLGYWTYAETVELNKVPDPFSDLKGSAEGKKLNFTWQRSSKNIKFYVSLYSMESGTFVNIAGGYVDGTSCSYTVAKDGMYILTLSACVEYDPGWYSFLNFDDNTTVQVFSGKTYTLKVESTAGGTVYPVAVSGNYPEDYKVNIWVGTDEHYRFVGWSDGNKEEDRFVTITSDLTLKAIFEPTPHYTLKVETTQGGKIKVTGMDGFGPSFEGPFEAGTEIFVESQPDDGYAFYQWSDGDAYDDRYMYLESDVTITAIFKPVWTVTLGSATNGKATYNGMYETNPSTDVYTVMDGTQAMITAVPNSGYRFTQWSDGDKHVVRQVDITADVTFTPEFEDAGTTPKYHVKVTPEMGGKVTGVDADFYEGDQLTIIAEPYSGYNFTKWSDGETSNPYTITVTKDITLTAQFELAQFTLTVSATIGGNIRVNGGEPAPAFSKKFNYATYITIEALPIKHYHFVKWSDGRTSSTIKGFLYTDENLMAVFALDQYLVTFLDEDGSFLEAKQFDYGSEPSCSITPSKAETDTHTYTFMGWDPVISAVTKATTYTAVYSATEKPKEEDKPGEGDKPGEDDKPGEEEKPDQALDAIHADGAAVKIFRDGTIFILRGDRIYTVTGQEVR